MRNVRVLTLLAGISFPAIAVAQSVPAVEPTFDEAAARQLQLRHSVPADQTAAPSDPSAAQAQAKGPQTDPSSFPPGEPPPLHVLSPDRPLTAKAKVFVKIASRWRRHFIRPSMGGDGRLHFIWGSGEPTVVCAPWHWCDIALEPGEFAVQPAVVGSPQWEVHLTLSGVGPKRVTHIMVKPSDSGLDSDVNLQTTKRTYSVQLISRSSEYMPLIAFDYPQTSDDLNKDWQKYAGEAPAAAGTNGSGDFCDQSPAIPPSSYHIGDGNYYWRPTQVYAVSTPVGLKTCIDMPSDIGSRALPTVVALNNDGTWFTSPTQEAESMQFIGRRFEIDGEVDSFVMIEGVGSSQNKIRVTRRNPA